MKKLEDSGSLVGQTEGQTDDPFDVAGSAWCQEHIARQPCPFCPFPSTRLPRKAKRRGTP